MRFLKWTGIIVGGFFVLMFAIGTFAGMKDPNYCFRVEGRRAEIVNTLQYQSFYRRMTERQREEAVMTLLQGYAAQGEFHKKCLAKYAMAPMPEQKVEDVSLLYRRR